MSGGGSIYEYQREMTARLEQATRELAEERRQHVESRRELSMALGELSEARSERELLRLEAEADSLADVALERAAEVESLRKQLVEVERERDEARAEVERLREALRGLLDRIDFVSQHDEYRAVWECAQLHRGPYRGPKYEDAFNAARAALGKRTP